MEEEKEKLKKEITESFMAVVFQARNFVYLMKSKKVSRFMLRLVLGKDLLYELDRLGNSVDHYNQLLNG